MVHDKSIEAKCDDPTLTEKGLKQALEVGHFLEEKLRNEGVTEIIIECSPFIRTIQTASQIAKALNIPKITTNYLFSEWQNKWHYKHNPLPFIDIKNKKLEIDGVEIEENLDYEYEANHLYPESLYKCIERVKKCGNYLKIATSD